MVAMVPESAFGIHSGCGPKLPIPLRPRNPFVNLASVRGIQLLAWAVTDTGSPVHFLLRTDGDPSCWWSIVLLLGITNVVRKGINQIIRGLESIDQRLASRDAKGLDGQAGGMTIAGTRGAPSAFMG